MKVREGDIPAHKSNKSTVKLSGPGMMQPVMPFWPDRKIGVVLFVRKCHGITEQSAEFRGAVSERPRLARGRLCAETCPGQKATNRFRKTKS